MPQINAAPIIANGTETGAQALSAVMRTPYDVVLMDIQMPEMDGITATRKIRELDGPQSEIPIIALTANAMVGDKEAYLGAGMSDYVTKPIEPAELSAALVRQCGTDIAMALKPPVAAIAAPAEDTPADLQDELNQLFSEM